MTREDALTFQAWSELSARCSGEPPEVLRDALEEAELTVEEYEAAELRHIHAIMAGLACGDQGLAEAHGKRCLEAKRARDRRRAEEAALDETVGDVRAGIGGAAPLPFRAPTPGEARAPHAVPSQPAEQSGETIGLGPGFAAGPSTPFERAGLEAWTLERYAELVADKRTASPEIVSRRYGDLTDRQQIALLAHFNRRFSEEPGLRERWEELVEARRRRGPG